MINRAFVVLFVLVVSLAGCKDKAVPGKAEVKRQTISGLTVQRLESSKVSDFYEATGTVKAQTVSQVSGRIMGAVKSVHVKEGDSVQKGQLLMTIDDADIAQKVRAAQKAVEAARENRSLMDITYKRYKNMYEQRAVTGQEMDQIETQRRVAEIEYERAQAMFAEVQTIQGFTRITSPQAGIVTSKKIDTGNMAVPGVPFFIIESTGAYHVEANIDERFLGRVNRGMEVEVSIDSLNKSLTGRVSEVVQAIDPQSRTFIVKISLSGAVLKSGLFARVKIPTDTRDAILAPEQSVVQKGQLSGVYTVDDSGLITYRIIKQGKRYGNAVEALSGLKVGDRIITAGVEHAVDGAILSDAKAGVKGQ